MILMQIISANIGVQAYIFKLMKSTLSLRKYRCQKLNTTSELRVLITFSNDKFKLHLLHCNYTLMFTEYFGEIPCFCLEQTLATAGNTITKKIQSRRTLVKVWISFTGIFRLKLYLTAITICMELLLNTQFDWQ